MNKKGQVKLYNLLFPFWMLLLFLMNVALFRICKHQLQAVFLVDLRRACVIVDGDDVDVGIPFLDGTHHTFAADMIGQTSERLCADDVWCAAVYQF